MALTANWVSGVIFVPKAFLTQIAPPPNEVMQLDLNEFRYGLRALEETDDGRPWPVTHRFVPALQLSTSVTVAPAVLLTSGTTHYMVEFEDGQYAVEVFGGNSNVAERALVNQVSVRSQNSAGLVLVDGIPTPQEVAAETVAQLRASLADANQPSAGDVSALFARINALTYLLGAALDVTATTGRTARTAGPYAADVSLGDDETTVTRTS